MGIVLYHHPFSRAAGVVWSLEEVGVPYELVHVDIMKGEQKAPDFLAKNPMGKLPTLTDGDLVVTEAAAIALYLGDRYAYGTLTPKVDEPKRGTYLRWAFFAPSVIEPGATAKLNKWEAKPGQVGWGAYDAMLTTMKASLSTGPFLLGDTFSMADVVFGGTLRYMLQFGMVEKETEFTSYVERITARPAYKRAEAKNEEIRKAHGLGG